MKNKKLMFSEARFVFGDPKKPAAAPGGTPAAAPEAGPTMTSARERELQRLLDEAKRKRLGAKSGVERGAVSKQLDLKEISMEGVVFGIKGYVRDGKLSISKSNIDSFKGMFHKEFRKADGVDALAKKYKAILGTKITLDEAKDFLENQYIALYLKKARDSFEAKYPHLEEYVKKSKIENFGITLNIKQVGDSHELTYVPKDRQLDGYKEWVKKNKKKGDKPKKSAVKKPKVKPEDATDAERDAALARLKKTSVGKLLNAMKDEDGETMLQKLEKGKAPMFILLLLGALGFKTLGGGVWEGVKDMTKGTKLEANINAVEKKIQGSRFAAVSEDKRRIAKFAQQNSRQFGENLANAGENGIDIPKKGLNLTQAYNFRGTAMKVTFASGARMVIPGPASILVNGNRTTVPKGQPRTYDYDAEKDKGVEIGGVLPKGTTFEGKVTIASVSAEKAKKPSSRRPKVAAKPEPKPSPAAKGKARKKAAPKKKA
jgi:hypothetical protein